MLRSPSKQAKITPGLSEKCGSRSMCTSSAPAVQMPSICTSSELVLHEPSVVVLQSQSDHTLWQSRGKITLSNSGAILDKSSFQAAKKSQRNSSNLYKTSAFFPSHPSSTSAKLTDEERLDRQSLAAARQYMCLGVYGCPVGDCLNVFQTADILRLRTEFMQRCYKQAMSTGQLLEQDLINMYDPWVCPLAAAAIDAAIDALINVA